MGNNLMANYLQAYRGFISKKEILLGLILLFILSQLTIILMTAELGSDFPGLQLTFSADRFLEIVQTWQSSDLLVTYYRHFILDYITHPLLYGLALSSFMAWAFVRRDIQHKYNIYLLLPFIATTLDIIENNLHLYLLTNLDHISRNIVFVSGACSWAKWIIAFACLLGTITINQLYRGGKENETGYFS